MIDADRLARLPKWAQAEIERLERDLAAWKARAAAGPEESDTFIDTGFGEQNTPLGTSPVIRFEPSRNRPGRYFHVYLSDDHLHVRGHPDGLLVKPIVNNVIDIYQGGRP